MVNVKKCLNIQNYVIVLFVSFIHLLFMTVYQLNKSLYNNNE